MVSSAKVTTNANAIASTSSTPTSKGSNREKGSKSGIAADLAALGLSDESAPVSRDDSPAPAMSMKRMELIEKIRKEEMEGGKKGVSLVVVGHVDAGKSTLMGRLLYDLGRLTEKEKVANERGSQRVGKSSFAYAWGLDALGDERERGVTIDIATSHFETPNRAFTLLDAPGHQDFIPNMISGASQADMAMLVVDASPGEFEAGFVRNGQTREHSLLVRSLGVRELIVAVNKMDVVNWSQDRFDEIQESLKPFLQAAGFIASRLTFVPVAAMEGINLLSRVKGEEAEWYKGKMLAEVLDQVEVPSRPLEAPLRFPISNVFKGQTAISSGVGVSGRLCSGVVQVGERIRIVPGDETAVVKTIEKDEEIVPYASAGQNVTLYLSQIDPMHLNIGSVLCPPNDPIPLANTFQVQVLVFDIAMPIVRGAVLEVFSQSWEGVGRVGRLVSVLEKGEVVKSNPRVLQKNTQAILEITLHSPSNNSSSSGSGQDINLTARKAPSIPLELGSVNKELGRVLLRRGGETVAAGVVVEVGGGQ